MHCPRRRSTPPTPPSQGGEESWGGWSFPPLAENVQLFGGDRRHGEEKWPPHVLANRTECAKLFIVVTQGGHDDDGSRKSVTKKAALLPRQRRRVPSGGSNGNPRWASITPHASLTRSSTDWIKPACRRVTWESDPWPITRNSCSRLSCTRPTKATCRPRNGLATSETVMPCDGSAMVSSPAGRHCTTFGTGCLSRSSRCTPRRYDRPLLTDSRPPRRACSTAHPHEPALRGINWSTRISSRSDSGS